MKPYLLLFLPLFQLTTSAPQCEDKTLTVQSSGKGASFLFRGSFRQHTCILTFAQCTYKPTCPLFKSSSPCLSTDTLTSQSWTSCTAACCDPSVSYPENLSAIAQCQDYLQTLRADLSKTTPLPTSTIVIITLGSILAVTLVVLILYNCLKSSKEAQDTKLPVASEFAMQSDSDRIIIKDPAKLTKFEQQWKPDTNQIDSESKCVICLKDCCTVLLPCQHVFHLSCSSEWAKLSPQCPLCKSAITTKCTLYCKNCHQQSSEVDLQHLQEKIDDKCKECKLVERNQ